MDGIVRVRKFRPVRACPSPPLDQQRGGQVGVEVGAAGGEHAGHLGQPGQRGAHQLGLGLEPVLEGGAYMEVKIVPR
ncbi:hypothetical protein GCM10020001_026030 [Nonomuraea salmonea]